MQKVKLNTINYLEDCLTKIHSFISEGDPQEVTLIPSIREMSILELECLPSKCFNELRDIFPSIEYRMDAITIYKGLPLDEQIDKIEHSINNIVQEARAIYKDIANIVDKLEGVDHE